MRYITLITAIVLSTGCASSANTYNPEEMADLASQLKDISAAVDGTLKFSSEPYTDPQKLLLTAIRGDKSRLTPFKNYQLKVVIQEQDAAKKFIRIKEKVRVVDNAKISHSAF